MRGALHRRRAGRGLWIALTVVVLAAGCRRNPEKRESALAAAGRSDSLVAHGATVRDLLSPTDSTRIIYTRPTPLALRSATATTTAPSGISSPDSARTGKAPTNTPGGASKPAAREPGGASKPDASPRGAKQPAPPTRTPR